MQHKRFNLEGATKLAFLYDTKSNVNGDTEVEFFPRTVSSSAIDQQNYDGNPFSPTSKDWYIVGIGFIPVLPWIAEATNIDPNNILAALQGSRVQIQIGSQTIATKMPFSQAANLSGLEAWQKNKLTAAAFASSVQNTFLPSSDVAKLEQPLKVTAGTVFTVKLFIPVFTLPTAAHWVTAAQGGALGFKCCLQYSRDKLANERNALD